ncbi:MAG: UDP-N-acetylmuramoyl-L-alanine--D-glutamate ligase [Thiotrichales bacterium]
MNGMALSTSPSLDQNRPWLVFGMGGTGRSVARFLRHQGIPCVLGDSRADARLERELRAEFPGAELRLGDCEAEDWSRYGRVILSPGVPRALACVQQAIAGGVEVVGDIELFARIATAPVVAVTGSNGKSTVVHLLWKMTQAAGWDGALGGNFGTPALDLLKTPEAEVYVLELSSFQLESTYSLRSAVATILNISEDHLDRYPDIEHYAAAKGRIFDGARKLVVNRDDPRVMALIPAGREFVSFGLDVPASGQFGLRIADAAHQWLAKGDVSLLPIAELRLYGRHNLANALAALALGEAIGLPLAAMLEALRQYAGLPHRTQWVRELGGVTWLNDSKATNVGATVAALKGLANPVILLAGGQGKGQDFGLLREAVAAHARAVLLFGEDAPKLERALAGASELRRVPSLVEAVSMAHALAESGDYVLLSPACASFDMFTGYAQRGDRFAALVNELQGGGA